MMQGLCLTYYTGLMSSGGTKRVAQDSISVNDAHGKCRFLAAITNFLAQDRTNKIYRERNSEGNAGAQEEKLGNDTHAGR